MWAEIEEEENLDGLGRSNAQTFRDRAVPGARGVLREGAELTNDAQCDVPSTIIRDRLQSADYQDATPPEPPVGVSRRNLGAS